MVIISTVYPSRASRWNVISIVKMPFKPVKIMQLGSFLHPRLHMITSTQWHYSLEISRHRPRPHSLPRQCISREQQKCSAPPIQRDITLICPVAGESPSESYPSNQKLRLGTVPDLQARYIAQLSTLGEKGLGSQLSEVTHKTIPHQF